MSGASKTRTIADLVRDKAILAIQDGNHGGSHPKADEYVANGVPFIMASDFLNGRLDLSRCKRLPKERTDRLRIGFARKNDVLLTHKGTVGEVAVVPPMDGYIMLTPQVTYYRVDSDKLDPIFLASAFRSQDFQAQLGSISAQSTRPYVAISTQRFLTIPYPPIETQRRIAAIVGAYDDLIEVNRRRVALLDDMARGLFEEWFVRLRFPGYEVAAIHETPDGKLPQGWRFVSLGDVAAINAASLKAASAPDEIGYVDIASVSPGQIDGVSWMPFSDAPGRARRIVRDGSILWSNVRPNRRSHALVLDPAPNTIASTGFTVLDAVKMSFAYLYHWVTTESFVGYLVGNASGAAYPAVTAATFDRATVLVPDSRLIERFTDFATPLLRQAETLRRTNQRLASSRDLLLPRLMSGQLSVVEAEAEAQKELEIA